MVPRFDQPLSWGITVGRMLGVPLRLHVTFLVFAVLLLFRPAPIGTGLRLIELTSLLLVVLLHETARLWIVRRYGGLLDEVILWPLGGLAPQRPAPGWRSAFIAGAAGPLAGLAIFAVLAPVLGFATGSWMSLALPSPLDWPAFGTLAEPRWVVALFIIHRVNFIVLLLNLIPMHPLDGARMLEALASAVTDPIRAARQVLAVGFIAAAVLGVAGWMSSRPELVALAFFGGLMTYRACDRAVFTRGVLAGDLPVPEAGEPSDAIPLFDASDLAEDEELLLDAESEVAVDSGDTAIENARLDDILAKIARDGIDALSEEEQAVLAAATERRNRD